MALGNNIDFFDYEKKKRIGFTANADSVRYSRLYSRVFGWLGNGQIYTKREIFFRIRCKFGSKCGNRHLFVNN